MKYREAAKPGRLCVRLACTFVALVGACTLSCARHTARTSPAAPVEPTKKSVEPQREPAPSGYSLAAGSARIVRSLKGPLEVDAYVMRGLPQLDQFTSDLAEVLAAYEQQGNDKFRFRLIEANSSELREQAKEEGLQEQPFREAGKIHPAKLRAGYLGLVLRYGSERAALTLEHGTDGLEYWLTNKIRELRDKADNIKHRIGVVAGKKELKLSDTNLVPRPAPKGTPSIESILSQAFPYYRIEEIDLKRGASTIDPDLAGLIITQPAEDYIEPELRRIDQFLMRGKKSLVVFASAVNLKPSDPKLQARLSTRGLEPLLDGYGIHVNKDAVFDHGSQFRVQVSTPSGEVFLLRHPGIPHLINDPESDAEQQLIDVRFAPFFRIDDLIFPFASSLQLMRDKQPGDVTLQVVAHSTSATNVETTDSVNMELRDHWVPKPQVAQRALAAYAQGKLQSAFAGAPSPDPEVPERAPSASRVLVISSSQFVTNPFAYAGNGGGSSRGDPQLLALATPCTKHLTSTILVIKNTLDWMIGDEDLIALSAKLGTTRRR